MLSRLPLAALNAVLRLSSHSMGWDFDLSPMALWRGSSTSACPGIDGAINLYAPIQPLSPSAVLGGSLSFSLLDACVSGLSFPPWCQVQPRIFVVLGAIVTFFGPSLTFALSHMSRTFLQRARSSSGLSAPM